MKLIYHINSLYNPGGMERVVLNKATWLVNHGWEVEILTTDQCGRPTFYEFPKEIKLIDLGINYTEDKGKNLFAHTFSFLKKRRLHKQRLTSYLKEAKADIVDTLYPGESSFIPGIKDGSKKVIELHQGRYFHRQYANKGIKGIIDRLREWADVRMVSKFDKFVVLTEEDKADWGDLPKMEVIPNAAIVPEGFISKCTAKRVIAVGRLDYQKSFDRLIKAWKIVCEKNSDWVLDIYGQGEWKGKLQTMINDANLGSRCHLMGTTDNIWKEYASSSIFVMSSHYEGLPMVMIEAMSCGLPAVSFDFKCGPHDIIESKKNGLIVPEGDIVGLADALVALMKDEARRKAMGSAATEVVEKYSKDKVMDKWLSCYE